MTARNLPPLVEEWVRQLCSPDMLVLLAALPSAQVDVTLSAAGGRVRRRPRIVIDGGPQQYEPPLSGAEG